MESKHDVWFSQAFGFGWEKMNAISIGKGFSGKRVILGMACLVLFRFVRVWSALFDSAGFFLYIYL